MEHSLKFEKLKGYYEAGFWSKLQIRHAVIKAWITPYEYSEITGEEYDGD